MVLRQESLQSSKTLAILELKDSAIEKLERDLDAVQSKLAEIKDQIHLEDLEAAECDRKLKRCQFGRDAAVKVMLAEERWEAASEKAEELRKDRDAVESVAERLMHVHSLHSEAENNAAKTPREQQGPQTADGLWCLLRPCLEHHKAQLSHLMEATAAGRPQGKPMEEKWMEERRCKEYKEELRWLSEQHSEVDGQWQALEKRALHDLSKAKSILKDEEKEALRLKKQMEDIFRGERGKLHQEIEEAEREWNTLNEELRVAEDQSHEVLALSELERCESLAGRLGSLTELESSMKARLQVFQKASGSLKSRGTTSKSWAHVLLEESVANTLMLQQRGHEEHSELNQYLQQNSSLEHDEAEQAERQKTLRKELWELSAKDSDLREPWPFPRLGPLLLRQLSELAGNGWSTEDSNLRELLENLMKLLGELQEQFLETHCSSQEWKHRVLSRADDPTPPLPAQTLHTKSDEEVAEGKLRDEATKTEIAKLEAAAAVLKSELIQQKKHSEKLKENHQVETAAAKVEAFKAEMRGQDVFFQAHGNWRDDLTESVWTMVQRVGYAGSLSASEPDQVLRAAEILRILGFQLCALELGWMLQQKQIYSDLLQCAAVRSKTSGAPAWRQRFLQLAEAERLRMDAVRLKSELQTMTAELDAKKSKEQSLALGKVSVDASLVASVDQDVLMSTLSTMQKVMQMCFRLVSDESEASKVHGDCTAQILQDVLDVGSCCQQLQGQLVRQKETFKSLAVRNTLRQADAMKELEQWPSRLEGLLGLQHDMQLEYKSAAEELLKLRESRSELTQEALKARQQLQLEEARHLSFFLFLESLSRWVVMNIASGELKLLPSPGLLGAAQWEPMLGSSSERSCKERCLTLSDVRQIKK